MFGNKKMYKKGLADAMQAYEAFGRKQEAALEHMREEVRKGNRQLEAAISDLGEDLNGIYGYLTSKEKAALYHLSTPMDIKDLEDEEKRLLLAILYQLSFDEGDGVTDAQRSYIRSVQKYLEITNPQTEAELSAVGDIDSLETQKSFLQVVLEFLYLQEGDELSDAQEDFLGYFSVNRKQAALIEERVSRLFNAVGNQGIAEKYGYVPEEEPGDVKVSETQYEGSGSFEKLADEIARMCFGLNKHCIETENYILVGSPDGDKIEKLSPADIKTPIYRINKKTGKWTRVRLTENESETLNFESILTSHSLYKPKDFSAVVVGDTIYYPDVKGNGLFALNVDTWQRPKRITKSSCHSISICGKKLAYVQQSPDQQASNICLYDFDTAKQSVVVSGVKNAKAVYVTPDGVFYSYDISTARGGLFSAKNVVSFYDIKGKKSLELLKRDYNSIADERPQLQKILFFDTEKVWVACRPNNIAAAMLTEVVGISPIYPSEIYCIPYKKLNGQSSLDIRTFKNLDILFMSNATFLRESILTYSDILLYVGKGGKLMSLDFSSEKSQEIAPNAIFADKRPAHLMRIGNWVYFEGNSSDCVNKVSLDNPGEVEMIEVYDDMERAERGEKIQVLNLKP